MPTLDYIRMRQNIKDIPTTHYNCQHRRITDTKYMSSALRGYAANVFKPSTLKNCRTTLLRQRIYLFLTHVANVGIGLT